MVIEVIIHDSNLQDTGEEKGELDVIINGKSLRMIQATDGNWLGIHRLLYLEYLFLILMESQYLNLLV